MGRWLGNFLSHELFRTFRLCVIFFFVIVDKSLYNNFSNIGKQGLDNRKYLLDFFPMHFFRVYIASSKHEEGQENSRQSRVCVTFENSTKPTSVKMRLCKHGKSALLLS